MATTRMSRLKQWLRSWWPWSLRTELHDLEQELLRKQSLIGRQTDTIASLRQQLETANVNTIRLQSEVEHHKSSLVILENTFVQMSLRHWHAFDYKHQPVAGHWIAVLDNTLLNTRVHLREFSTWEETLSGIAAPWAWTTIPPISETLITRGPPKTRKQKPKPKATDKEQDAPA